MLSSLPRQRLNLIESEVRARLLDFARQGDAPSWIDPEPPISDGMTEDSREHAVRPLHDGRALAAFVGRALTPPGRVLYVDMENSEDDWTERLDDFGVTPTEAASWNGRFLPLSFPVLDGLDTKGGAAQLMAVIDSYGIGSGDLLVLDSMQRVTEGEENSNDTTRKLYNYTSVELKRRGITVIRTDNTGHEGDRARGGSAKRDDVAFAWALVKVDGTDDTFTLKPVKRRAAGSSDKLTFSRVTNPSGRLDFVASSGVSFSSSLSRVGRALADAKVSPSAGQAAAWAAVQALPGGVPDGVTRALVRRVQHERRESITGLKL
jgi:hypothetical protein